MLYWALVLLIVVMMTLILGFGVVAVAAAAGLAKVMFFTFLGVFVLTLISGLARRGRIGL